MSKPEDGSHACLDRNDLHIVRGAFAPEHDGLRPFFWSGPELVLRCSRPIATIVAELHSPMEGAVLHVSRNGTLLADIHMGAAWDRYALPISARRGDEVVLAISKTFQPDSDSRALGLCIRRLDADADPELASNLQARQENRRLNHEEYLCGREMLESHPVHLAITMERRCNIANTRPCTYCPWDWAKALEQGDFHLDSLDRMGLFYSLADKVTDCSYGEPSLHPRFRDIVRRITRSRRLSTTLNGQTLGPGIRRLLLGRDMDVYLSIDAATPATYARFRNHRFDQVIANLRSLCREKRDHGNLPVQFVSFILMRSNRHELEDVVRLMADIGIDVLNLRFLYAYAQDIHPLVTRSCEDVPFRYAEEAIPHREWDEATLAAQELGARLGLKVLRDGPHSLEAFGPGTHDGAPLCNEPWLSAYLLNRGIQPCCWGEPVTFWEKDGLYRYEYARDMFNGRVMRSIRRSLAAGELSSYCRQQSGCPIVRAHLKR